MQKGKEERQGQGLLIPPRRQSFRNTWDPEKGGRLPKPYFFKLLKYEYYEHVVGEYHASEARERIISSPARTSKSYAAAHDLAWSVLPDMEAVKDRNGNTNFLPISPRELDDRRIWCVGPDFQTNKEFDYLYSLFVTRASGQFRKALNYNVVTKANSPKQGNMEILLDFGQDKDGNPVRTVIQGRSAVKKESLQGEEVDDAVLSEAAEHPEEVMSKYLGTRVRRISYPTTPKIKAEWLMRKIDLANANPGLGIESFRFTPKCNPAYDWRRFWNEHQKAESRILHGKIITVPPKRPSANNTMPDGHDCFEEGSECQAMKDPDFGEQFGGLWTMHGDRVIPFRWNDRAGPSHVVDEIPFWWANAKKYISVDWGFRDAAVAIWWAMASDGTFLAYREIYESELASDLFVKKIIEMTPSDERIEYVACDPQQPNVRDYMRRKGLRLSDRAPKKMRDRKLGYYKLIDALATDPATGRPKLFVASEKCGDRFGCPNGIHEWKTLYAKDGAKEDRWNALVGNDHFYDATRYFLCSNPYRPVPEGRYLDDDFDEAIERQNLIRANYNEYASSWT